MAPGPGEKHDRPRGGGIQEPDPGRPGALDKEGKMEDAFLGPGTGSGLGLGPIAAVILQVVKILRWMLG